MTRSTPLQQSLFSAPAPAFDADFRSLERIALDREAWMYRRRLLRPRGGGASRAFQLGEGDLLVTGGDAQRTWEHCVPKVARAGPRISLAFRGSPRRASSPH